MRNILVRLVCSVMVLLFLTFGLSPSKCHAQTQVQKLMDQGTKQMQNQKYDQAIATFKKALKEEPKSAALYNLLGMAYRFKYNQVRNQELKQQEIEAFKKAIEIDSNYWVALINLGATYYHQGDKAKAAPLFEKALAINPDHPQKAELEKMIQEGKKK
ncbi:MAG: tetratricopeptide repeat protein [Thermodesulfobacteriota bacterium]